jgi:hypothetical protein
MDNEWPVRISDFNISEIATVWGYYDLCLSGGGYREA